MKGHVAFALAWQCFGLLVVTTLAANDQPYQLETNRNNRRSQLATARIECRYVAKVSKARLSAKEVAAIFDRHNLDDHPEKFERVIRELVPSFPQDKPIIWGLELIIKPGKTSEEITSDRSRRMTVRSGGNEVCSRSQAQDDDSIFSQVYIYPIGATHYRIMNLHHFELEPSNSDLVVKTGVSREVRQYINTQFAGGKILPRITIRIRYRDGHLDLVKATYIESAAFGIDIPDSAFRVSAERGVHLFDCRRPRDEDGRPLFIPLSQGTDDVIETADTYEALDAFGSKRL